MVTTFYVIVLMKLMRDICTSAWVKSINDIDEIFFVKILFPKVKQLYPSFWKSGIKTFIMVFHDTMLLS